MRVDMFKKKIILFLSIVFLSVNLWASACFAEENNRIILIDPGHGGMDGGAVSKSGINEKNINLQIGLMLKEELKQMGYDIYMTREEDKGLYSERGSVKQKKIEDLNKRCTMKKETNCDLFISIHVDKFQDPKLCGTGVWYSNNIESEKLAEVIHKNVKKDVNYENKRQPKAAKDAYKVLRCNDSIPSIIVECGFISNSAEVEKLVNPDYQRLLAKTLAGSIEEYFKEYDSKGE